MAFLAASLVTDSAFAGSSSVSLAGTWRFDFDRGNRGVQERWFAKELGDRAVLPGCLSGQGKGDVVTVETKMTGSLLDASYYSSEHYAEYRAPGRVKMPFWLQPETYYAGPAWYQRDVEIPETWKGKRVVLTLERAHWESRVWLDEREIGSNNSLSTAHVYDLGTDLAVGRHKLTLRVDNGRVVEIGENSSSITDHTQGNWNGVVGAIELSATEPVWIDELQVYPVVESKSAKIAGRIQVSVGAKLPQHVELGIEKTDNLHTIRTVAVDVGPDGAFSGEIQLEKDAPLWSEFQPALHRLSVRLENGERREVVFGLREISTRGQQLILNGEKAFIRATLECAIFPKTGFPPTDVASWKALLQVARDHGLNSLRFHSWCPPEAAFVAGDEMGFYFQIEAASWPFISTSLGDGKPVDEWLEQETLRILRAYGNHPSFILFASCNEPQGDQASPWLAKWLVRHRAADPRRLFTSGAGWPQLEENQYHVTSDTRIQHWEEGLKSRINSQAPETRTDYREYIAARKVPVITHEMGQWCVFPDFSEMPEYAGFLKPRNFEIFQETLRRNGLADRARAFLHASGKLQVLCYKEDIEAVLRTPGMGGFQLLDLHDFPGQGTALVGVVNAFWGSKGYVTADEYRRFCDSTVPLTRMDRRVFTTAETLEADCEVAHFGPKALVAAASSWRLVGEDGKVLAKGSFPVRDIPLGNGIALGKVQLSLKSVPAPARYRLVVGLDGTRFENDWDLWVYPAAVDTSVPPELVITDKLDAAALATLKAGGSVFLSIPPNSVRNDGPDPVLLGFSSIFWNTSWTNRQAPTTLGVLCDPKHQALAEFPTDEYSNWQWWYLVTNAAALRLDACPKDLQPVVSVIDDWFTCRRLALVVEARVGGGRLLITSIDLNKNANPVSRQMKASLLHYAGSAAFKPSVELSVEQVRGLMVAP